MIKEDIIKQVAHMDFKGFIPKVLHINYTDYLELRAEITGEISIAYEELLMGVTVDIINFFHHDLKVIITSIDKPTVYGSTD